MKWQEYQDAVARLYEQARGLGEVRRNVYLPDLVTGQRRQVDVLLDIDVKGHRISVLIDAKYREGKIDVKDVEEVISLAAAVGANKCVVVTCNGWSEPAARRASFAGVDLRLLDIEQALDLIVRDKWQLCPECEQDCIVLDHDGAIEHPDGTISVFLAGQCRSCRAGFAWCWECGEQGHLHDGRSFTCGCGHSWVLDQKRMAVRLSGQAQALDI